MGPNWEQELDASRWQPPAGRCDVEGVAHPPHIVAIPSLLHWTRSAFDQSSSAKRPAAFVPQILLENPSSARRRQRRNPRKMMNATKSKKQKERNKDHWWVKKEWWHADQKRNARMACNAAQTLLNGFQFRKECIAMLLQGPCRIGWRLQQL